MRPFHIMRELTQFPLDLSVEWISKLVTTDPPRLTPHEEWRLSLSLAADAPIHAAVLLYLEEEVSWGLWQEQLSDRVEISLRFFPFDWPASDEMQISFGWLRIRLTDPDLKTDPRGQITILAPSKAATGEIIPVCELRGHRITAAVFAVAGEDTEIRRQDRWRVRPELTTVLPPDLIGLSSGHQSGVAKRHSSDGCGATDEPLTHNPLNGVTEGLWRRGRVVHKVLTRRREAPPHWASSEDPRHWNYWRREALVFASGLPERLGLAAPHLLEMAQSPEGDVELRLEHVEGRHSGALTIEDLEAAAEVLGRVQGQVDLPDEPWLSQGFLRAYSGARPVDWALMDDDDAWAQPLMREHFDASLQHALVRLHRGRDGLLRLMENLPRTVCHLDVWPNNLIRQPGGDVVFLDWAFVGDGALGEDIGNLIPDSVFDLLLHHDLLDELDARLTSAYLRGLREAGWNGDARLVRLGICASAVKYDWLTASCLEFASADEQLDYGHIARVDADERYAARAAGLALCARWGQEAAALAQLV